MFKGENEGVETASAIRGVQAMRRNMIRCRQCGDTIESKHRHDYVSCKCGAVAVDGGNDYHKRSFPADMSPEQAYEDLGDEEEE